MHANGSTRSNNAESGRSRPARPPAGSPRDLLPFLALQRSAGNTAVVQMLAEAGHAPATANTSTRTPVVARLMGVDAFQERVKGRALSRGLDDVRAALAVCNDLPRHNYQERVKALDHLITMAHGVLSRSHLPSLTTAKRKRTVALLLREVDSTPLQVP